MEIDVGFVNLGEVELQILMEIYGGG